MSKRDIELFIFDIFIAIMKIEHTALNFKNAQELLYNYNAWDSVIREFEIIGEASKHLLREKILDKSYQEVVDFRNIVVHEYFGIDHDEVWGVIHNSLPEFKKVILKLISNLPENLKYELIDAYIEDNRYLDFIVKQLQKSKSI